jgi:hypothetical protein
VKHKHKFGLFVYKKIAAFAIILVFALSVAVTNGQPSLGPSAGVKVGDWIEYAISTTGTPPAAQDITWAKIEILSVQGAVIEANFTVKYVNGTLSSSPRNFNFTAGQTQAWIIIPGNLGPGESFYDSSINANVTIQGQMQKTVAGASRTITYTNSTLRNKEWDKATGMFTQTQDNEGNYTVYGHAIATNIWSPQILGLDQTVFYAVVVTIIVVLAIVVLAVVFVRRKRISNKR